MGTNAARNMPPPSSGTSVLKAVCSSEDLVYAYLHGVIMQKTTMWLDDKGNTIPMLN